METFRAQQLMGESVIKLLLKFLKSCPSGFYMKAELSKHWVIQVQVSTLRCCFYNNNCNWINVTNSEIQCYRFVFVYYLMVRLTIYRSFIHQKVSSLYKKTHHQKLTLSNYNLYQTNFKLIPNNTYVIIESVK